MTPLSTPQSSLFQFRNPSWPEGFYWSESEGRPVYRGEEMSTAMSLPCDCGPFNFFWTDDGWCVDLREHRNYPIYGEGDWTLRTDNMGIGCRG